MSFNAVRTVWREGGAGAIARKTSAALRMALPIVLLRRRTAAGVAAYFDLITDDGRLFYGDDFHFGYFPTGRESFAEAIAAHTDLVADLARPKPGEHVLDVGCGVGAPAVRIARRLGCRITGVNISREQVRQGRELLEREGVADLVSIERADARKLPFADETFDAIVCLEVASDICVTERDKDLLVQELCRVLKPGGRVGFSDLALRQSPTRRERRVLRSLLYHAGDDLVSDWPAIFTRHGFFVSDSRCILAETMPTWKRTSELYASRAEELDRRYGPRIARKVSGRVRQLPTILDRLGTYPVLGAVKPPVGPPSVGRAIAGSCLSDMAAEPPVDAEPAVVAEALS